MADSTWVPAYMLTIMWCVAAQPSTCGVADIASGSGSLASLEAIDKRVADAVSVHHQSCYFSDFLAQLRPLHTQMSSLKSEVERLKVQVAEIPELQRTVRNLATEVEELRHGWAEKVQVPEDPPKATQPSISIPSPVPPSGTPSRMTPGKYGSLIRSGRR